MKPTNEISELTENLFKTMREPLIVLDKNLNVINANQSFYNFFKLTPVQTIGTCIYDLGNHHWQFPKLKELLEIILPEKLFVENYEIEQDSTGTRMRRLILNARQIERTPEKENIILIAIEDITEQRGSEKITKVPEDEFREIVEHSADAIFIVDHQGRYIYTNTKAIQMLGYSKEEMLLLTIADVSPKNRLEEYFGIFKQTLQEGSFFAEIQLLKKDGNLLTTDLNTALLPNGHIYGSCRDITDRKRAEESLRESHQFIEDIINSIPVRVFWKDSNLTYLGCNNLFARDAGFTNQKELIGKDDFQMGWRDQAELYRDDDRKVIETGRPKLLIEEPQTTPEGKTITLLTSKIPLRNSTDKIVGVLGIYMDITERKLAEEKLQESEEKYRELVEGSPDGIIIHRDGIIVFANRSSASMMRGSGVDKLIGKSVIEFVHPSYKEIIFNKMIEMNKTGKSLPFAEEKFLRLDGSEFDVEVKAIPIIYEKKSAVQIIVRDITMRKQIEFALKTSEERFRTAAGNLSEVIYDWDIKQKLDWYGDIDGITGYPPGGFPRTIEGWKAVIHPEDKDRIIAALENHIKGNAPYSTEYRIKRSDGAWRWWSARGTALRDDQGKPYKMIGSITDITEQKDIQNRIKFKSELLSHIGQAVIATDLQGNVIYWNNGAEEIYGWSSAEAMGQNIVVLTPTEQAKENAIEIMKALSEGKSWSGEFLVKRKDGSIFPANVTDAPIIDSNGKLIGIIGISNDITERKQSEEEIKKSHEELVKLNAEKDKFFSIIAHDLKSPFNGFLNLTALMADTTKNISLDEFSEYSKMLNKSVRNIYMLLNNLLEWAQIQKGTIQFTPTNFDLAKLVSRSIETISQRAMQKQIEIINEISNSQNVYADEKIINTVLRNLLSNAVKFTRTGGKVIVKTKRFDDGIIQVLIEDNGVGISEDIINKLFRIDQKIGSIGTDGETSTGLGLLLCKEFVEMHGQKIWAESEINKGSTFSFNLREEK